MMSAAGSGTMDVRPQAPSAPARATDLLSIIVPVYNEEGTVRAVLERLLAIALPVPREVLVIDDGSRDGTREVLTQAQGDGLPITVILEPRNRGKGYAIRRGIELARG